MCCICVYSFGNNNIDNCLRDGGVAKGRGTHFEHVPTNELYCAPGDVYDSFKPLCLCMCVRVPTYWQLRDLNSLIFSNFYMLLSCFTFFMPLVSHPFFPSLPMPPFPPCISSHHFVPFPSLSSLFFSLSPLLHHFSHSEQVLFYYGPKKSLIRAIV